jgi:hypothetical protein
LSGRTLLVIITAFDLGYPGTQGVVELHSIALNSGDSIYAVRAFVSEPINMMAFQKGNAGFVVEWSFGVACFADA